MNFVKNEQATLLSWGVDIGDHIASPEKKNLDFAKGETTKRRFFWLHC